MALQPVGRPADRTLGGAAGADVAVTQRASYTSGLFFGALSFASMLVLGLGSSIALARVYGVEVIGEYAILLASMMAVNLLSTLREQEALIRDIASFDRRDPRITGRFYATLGFSIGLTTVAGLVVSAVLWFVLPSAAIDRPSLVGPALAIVAGYTLIDKVGWNADVVLAAFRAGRELFWVRLVQALTMLGVAIAAGVLADPGVWGLVLGTIAAWVAALVLRAIYLRRFARLRVSRNELREGAAALPGYLRFGVRAGGGSFANTLSDTAPVWILAPLAPVAIVGAWSRVELLTARLTEGLVRVAEMLFPTLVERREEGDIEGYERVLVDTVRYVVGGTLLVAAALGGARDGVMDVFGPGFDAAAGALAVIMLAGPLHAIAIVQQLALYSVDRPLATTVAALVRMGLTIALGIGLVMLVGVVGVAVAVVVALTASTVIQGRQLRRELRGSFMRFWPRRSLLATALAYGAGFGVAWAVDANAVGHLATLLALVAGTFAYLAVFLASGGTLSRDRERAGRALARARALRAGPPRGGGGASGGATGDEAHATLTP